MQTVVLRPLFHRGQEMIAAGFPKDKAIEIAVRKLKGIKWTQTHKAWYLPLSKENFQRMVQAVKPLATLDYSPLKQYLEKRKRVTATQRPTIGKTQRPTDSRQPVKPAVATTQHP